MVMKQVRKPFHKHFGVRELFPSQRQAVPREGAWSACIRERDEGETSSERVRERARDSARESRSCESGANMAHRRLSGTFYGVGSHANVIIIL